MSRRTHIAVLDIGKTNKKVMVFGPDLKLLDSVYQGFKPTLHEGVPVEDTAAMMAWFTAQLAVFSRKYPIGAISVTTHGATFAAVDEKGELVFPVIDYTFEPGDDFQARFFAEFGAQNELQVSTATPHMGTLTNCAKTLYWMKGKHPEKYARIRHLLFYPQYFGFLMTGKFGTEPTYLGCHTYLWDFKSQKPSPVATALGVAGAIPLPLKKSWEVLGTLSPDFAGRTGLGADTQVTLGIHDSNSSLLPYLVQNTGTFTLNSTGTWCVPMRPAKDLEFAPAELGKLVFFNLDAWSRPVKTALFMGGLEYDAWAEVLKKVHGEGAFPKFNESLTREILREKKSFIMPGVVMGTGQFPDSTPRLVDRGQTWSLADLRSGKASPELLRDRERSFAVLNLSLAIQSAVSLDRVGVAETRTVYTEGGFRKNDSYNRLMTAFYPGIQFSLTNLSEATAFGAAMLGKAALDGTGLEPLKALFTIESQPVEPLALPELSEYRKAWESLL
ncbi:MAG: carbohydrate kinase [Spirochaetes bacterium]|nr:carbohydrate kinase [Spirochaetota bacterium]